MSVKKNLTADNVYKLFLKCVDPEKKENSIFIEGLVLTAFFKPEAIKADTFEILGYLEQLPIEFKAREFGGGGGWTFLNMPANFNKVVWGQQADAQMLMMLAMASRHMVYCMADRKKWAFLPGNVPYVEWSPRPYKGKHDIDALIELIETKEEN
jgi:hypothetical protein